MFSRFLVGKKHKKWVKMEKFTPLAKILHCRRHWRHGQIPPLLAYGSKWWPCLRRIHANFPRPAMKMNWSAKGKGRRINLYSRMFANEILHTSIIVIIAKHCRCNSATVNDLQFCTGSKNSEGGGHVLIRVRFFFLNSLPLTWGVKTLQDSE